MGRCPSSRATIAATVFTSIGFRSQCHRILHRWPGGRSPPAGPFLPRGSGERARASTCHRRCRVFLETSLTVPVNGSVTLSLSSLPAERVLGLIGQLRLTIGHPFDLDRAPLVRRGHPGTSKTLSGWGDLNSRPLDPQLWLPGSLMVAPVLGCMGFRPIRPLLGC